MFTAILIGACAIITIPLLYGLCAWVLFGWWLEKKQ